MDVIEIHPRSATIDNIYTPDRMIFDLDLSKMKKAALESENDSKRRTCKFREMHGGQGPAYHGVIGTKNTGSEVKGPESTSQPSSNQNAEEILIDFFRNDYTATGIAIYSLRARPERQSLSSGAARGDQAKKRPPVSMQSVLKPAHQRLPKLEIAG